MLLPLLLAALVVLGVGVYLLGYARRRRSAAREFLAGALPAPAEVTDLRLRQPRYNREHDDGFWVPVVRFALPDGRVVEAETMTGTNPAPARVGDRVEVRYDPSDPRRVNLAAGPAQPGAVGCVLTGLAVAFVVFGGLLLAAWFLLAVVVGVPS